MPAKGKSKITYFDKNAFELKFSKKYKEGIGVYPSLKIDSDEDGVLDEISSPFSNSKNYSIELDYSKKGMKFLNNQKINKSRKLYKLEQKL